MTLHNYRIMCPTATFFVNGRSVERSIANGPWWAVKEATYRGSYVGTFFLALMIDLHRRVGTWVRPVDRLIALSQDSKQLFVQWGIPERKLVVKPNFVDSVARDRQPGSFFLFVGRLSREKGIDVLLKAVASSGGSVRIAGDGPVPIKSSDQVVLLGPLSGQQVEFEMSRACALIVPSVCPETFGLVVVEAFAQGTPVIASRIGALKSIVEHGVNGLLFDPGDANALRDCMRWATANPVRMMEMGKCARKQYEERYSSESNYSQMISIYESAIRSKGLDGRGDA